MHLREFDFDILDYITSPKKKQSQKRSDRMPKLIVTSRYLKKGAVKKLQNYVKYIATREGSVTVKENSGNEPATEKQCELIGSLLREFPDSTQTFAYEDYSKASTQKNASALISEIIENNVDRIGERENYIGYLANRPGAVKFDTHALFSQEDTPIDLNAVAKEIANHGGNVWTHVVALRRDNAQRMGYDNLTAWRELVKRQIPNIAKAQKIDMQNLRWYAAFHDKETNPHVHIVVYSTDEREGFLTKTGIEQIRSGFANDIYQDELHHLYARQTEVRDLLKKESAELMQQLSAKVQSDTSFEPELCQMIQLCRKQLQKSKGKKVYGYLKPEVKRTVDRIFELLASNESIQKMYDLWCEMEQQKHDVYSSAKITPPALIENPQFKSVKNMIIRAVLDMNMPEPSPYSVPQNDDSDDTAFSDIDNDVFTWNDEDAVEVEAESSNLHIQWSKDYKRACKLYYKKDATGDEKKEAVELLHSEAEKGNVLAIHDLGKVYADDKERSDAYYKQALNGFLELEPMSQKLQPYLQYRIGKMYCYGMGTKQNYAESFSWFLKSAYAGNKFAQFSLANQYYYGNGFYARFKSFEDFVELWVLAADAYFTADCLASFRQHDVDPFASGLLVECAPRYQDAAFWLAELQVEVVGLAGADIRRLLSAESEFCLELAVPYLREHLADDRIESLVLPFECRFQSGEHPVDIVLIHFSNNLEVALGIHLADLRSAADRLPEIDIQQSEHSVDRSLDLEILLPSPDHLHVELHVVEAFLHLLDLHASIYAVLLCPCQGHFELLLIQSVIFLGSEELFLSDEIVCQKPLLRFECPLLSLHFGLELKDVQAQVHLLLLHLYHRVSERILLLCQIRLRVEDLKVEVVVAQPDDNISGFNRRSFLDDYFLDDTGLARAELYGRHRLYLTAEADVVVEFAGCHIADRQSLFIDPERARIVTEDQPENECGHEGSEPVGKCLARECEGDALLLFYRSVHCL